MSDSRELAWRPERLGQSGRDCLAAYGWCVAAALAVGLVYDRFGAARTVAAVCGAVVMLLGLRDFRVFAAAAAFLLPFVPTTLLATGAAGLSGQKILGLALMATLVSVFMSYAIDQGRLRFPRWSAIFLAFLAVFVLAALNGARNAPTMPDYFKVMGVVVDTSARTYLQVSLLLPMLVVFAAVLMGLVAANSRRSAWIVLPVFASAVPLAGMVVWHALFGTVAVADLAQQESRRQLSALGMHANEIGLALNMALALVVCALGTVRRAGLRFVLALCSLILMAGVAMTFSRGGFLGLLVVFAYALLACRGGRGPLFLLAGIVLAIALSSGPILERAMHGLAGGDVGDISSGRVDQIWMPLLPELFEHPLFGNGHASILWSEAAHARTILPVGHPHSAYLALLLDVGIIGTVVTLLFMAHMWKVFRTAAGAQDALALRGFFRGAGACIPLMLVQGVTDDSFMPGFTHAYLWLAYGAAVGSLARQPRRAPRRAPPDRPREPAEEQAQLALDQRGES